MTVSKLVTFKSVDSQINETLILMFCNTVRVNKHDEWVINADNHISWIKKAFALYWDLLSGLRLLFSVFTTVIIIDVASPYYVPDIPNTQRTAQLEAANRQLRSTRQFVEEQASEREAERDEFARRLAELRDENARLATRLQNNARILNEVRGCRCLAICTCDIPSLVCLCS